MSGGYFNSIPWSEIDTLRTESKMEDIQGMVVALGELGNVGKPAAEKTQELIKKLEEINRLVEEAEMLQAQLRPVWIEMDYWKSLDSGKDDAIQACETFNK